MPGRIDPAGSIGDVSAFFSAARNSASRDPRDTALLVQAAVGGDWGPRSRDVPLDPEQPGTSWARREPDLGCFRGMAMRSWVPANPSVGPISPPSRRCTRFRQSCIGRPGGIRKHRTRFGSPAACYQRARFSKPWFSQSHFGSGPQVGLRSSWGDPIRGHSRWPSPIEPTGSILPGVRTLPGLCLDHELRGVLTESRSGGCSFLSRNLPRSVNSGD